MAWRRERATEPATAPSPRAQGQRGDGGYNLLVALLADLAAASGIEEPDAWDPLVVWSSLHGLASLRLDAALRGLLPERFALARDRVLDAVLPGRHGRPTGR